MCVTSALNKTRREDDMLYCPRSWSEHIHMSGHILTLVVSTHHTQVTVILDAVGVLRIIEAVIEIVRQRRQSHVGTR